MKLRAHIFIEGLVQGVFFRSEIQNQAKKHQVTGWVRNLSDGRVEAVFEGEEKDVKELVEFCKHGPIGAKVENVIAVWTSFTDEFGNFELKW